MKNSFIFRKLIISVIAVLLLLYFMINTTSTKLVFIPFLICSLSMIGKSVAQIFGREKVAEIFQRLFVIGFLLFFMGFLLVVCYISIRDKNYSMLIFSIPFWIVGIILFRNKLLNRKSQKHRGSGIDFRIVISVALVVIVLFAGVFLIVLGINRIDTGLIFTGAFFAFGAFTFVLAALMIMGYLDRFKIDVFGLYVGVLFVVIGIGFTILISTKKTFGLWILIPVLMAGGGVLQIVKCLRNRK